MLYRFVTDFNYTSILRSMLQIKYWYLPASYSETLHFDVRARPRLVYFLNKYIDASPYVNEIMLILRDRITYTRYSKHAWADDIRDILRCVKWLRSIEK